jgi:small subunit ribosomal protein S2
MKELLEAGVHFGHQTKRWNPKMKDFIFGERNGIYIIDLQKTHRLLQDALQYAQDLAAQGRTILFVGTKRQAQEAVAEEAQRAGMPYVNERWLGGLLTNFVTIRKSLDRLRELESMSTDGRHERLTKKEVAQLEKERIKIEKNLKGIKGMKNVPGCHLRDRHPQGVDRGPGSAKLKIPVIGIVDTNCDPDEVDHVIPGQRRRPARDQALRRPHRGRGAGRARYPRVAGRRKPLPTRARTRVKTTRRAGGPRRGRWRRRSRWHNAGARGIRRPGAAEPRPPIFWMETEEIWRT